MDSVDMTIPKAFGSDTSSSAMSAPKEHGRIEEAAKDQQLLQEFMKSHSKEQIHYRFDKERKQGQTSKSQNTGELSKAKSTKACRNMGPKKQSSNRSTSTNNQAPPRKQLRKGEHPVRFPPSVDATPDSRYSTTWICKNSACKAVLTFEDTFCKRCSCCICHLFDENKDPSLWLVCTSESGDQDWCGLSCHIECALQRQKAGVVDLGQVMQLDGSYCCASCGKVSGILECWKKQLAIAKAARRVDVLCHRLYLSYRLLDGTSRFEELHKIVEDAKGKLETEVGSVNGVSAQMARGIVSRLSVAGDVQRLCSLAIDKADEWLNSNSVSVAIHRGSLPSACRFLFEGITSSSVVIVLKDTSLSASAVVKGYKFWYCKSNEQPYKSDPVIFPKEQRRILVSHLQPCTEYTFHIISFTEDGDLGHSESKCFTKSVELFHKHNEHNGQNGAEGCSSSRKRESKSPTTGSSFKVRNLGKILRVAWAQEEGCDDSYCNGDVEEESCDATDATKLDIDEKDKGQLTFARGLDLNVASVPDLNDDIILPIDDSPDENGCNSEKNETAGPNGSGDSQTLAIRHVEEAAAIESRPKRRKHLAMVQEENCDGDSTLVNSSPLRISNGLGQLDENYEYCVKVVRWLECTGHIKEDFRMKFLTWFSLRSTEQERRVVITFIRTLIEEPGSLAGQLMDSFLEIVTCKRLRNGFCSKLWH